MKHDRMVSLACSHARLKEAQEMLRWAMTAETRDVVPLKEVEEMIAKMKVWGDCVYNKLREVR
jgi:hypothetical protein